MGKGLISNLWRSFSHTAYGWLGNNKLFNSFLLVCLLCAAFALPIGFFAAKSYFTEKIETAKTSLRVFFTSLPASAKGENNVTP